jgi:alkylhydroperoxidase family enzyme
VVPEEDKKRAAFQALVDRVLNGEGRSSAQQRARAFDNADIAPPVDALISKVATRPAQVTELRMLGKLTREGNVNAGDMRDVLAAGVSREQVEDALAVCAAFNTTDRLADAFGFGLLSPEGFESGAKYLLKRGYR